MSCGSVLVTGANRGIGLEFVRQLVLSDRPPRYVFATYRNKDTIQTKFWDCDVEGEIGFARFSYRDHNESGFMIGQLFDEDRKCFTFLQCAWLIRCYVWERCHKLKALQQIKESSKACQVKLIQMDVTKKEEVQSLRKLIEECVGEEGLNLLINNAGALKLGGLAEITAEDMNFHFATNTVGSIILLKEILPLLQKAAASKKSVLNLSKTTVLNISSMVGSITNLDTQPDEILDAYIAYRTSKAALNMAMRNIALVLKDQDILVVNMCPGWVRTDMGTDAADIDVTESASCMLDTLHTLDQSRQGDFLDRHGKAIPF